MDKYVIIVAGGQGLRMGSPLPKQFLLLNGFPVIFHTVEKFSKALPGIRTIVVLHPDYISYWHQLKEKFSFDCECTLCTGGSERFFSVKNGLDTIGTDEALVGIHDAVRPLVSADVIRRTYSEAEKSGAVVPVVSATDSVRLVDDRGDSQTIDRSRVQLVQTPQVFRLSLLRKAYSQPYTAMFTDDASVVEASGHHISLVNGNRENIKLTTPIDLKLAELAMKQTR
jgi:2-C-methyl-D-erythritol 4-phosphate cytidylyltransferase